MKLSMLFQLFLLVVYKGKADYPNPAEIKPSSGLLLEEDSQLDRKVVNIDSISKEIDTRKTKIPQFMLDLFAVLSSKRRNAFGKGLLEGTFIRSFHSEGKLFSCF